MTTSYDVARSLVTKLGGDPSNGTIVRAVAIWLRFESTTIYGNNPWNMRPGRERACTKGVDGKGFVIYCTLDDGISATAQRLNTHDYRGYGPVGDAIRAGDGVGFFRALAASKWSSDNYGGGTKLINALASATNYNFTLSFATRGGGSTGGGTGGGGTTTDKRAQALAFLASLGIPTNDLDYELTEADVAKIAAKYDVGPELFHGLIGISIKEFQDKVESGSINFDPIDAVGDTVNNVGDVIDGAGRVLSFLLDTENWLYIIMTLVGLALLWWASNKIINATGQGSITERTTA